MATNLEKYLAKEVIWERNADPEYPYKANFEGKTLSIRLNDFPDENLFTLLIENIETGDFDDWPVNWTRPLSVSPSQKRMVKPAALAAGGWTSTKAEAMMMKKAMEVETTPPVKKINRAQGASALTTTLKKKPATKKHASAKRAAKK